MKIDKNKNNIFTIGLSILIIFDIIFLIFSLAYNLSDSVYFNIILFDTFVCILLLIEFFSRFSKSGERKKFIINNFSELYPAIPFDLIFIPILIIVPELAGLLILLKFIKIILLAYQFFKTIGVFLKDTYLDEIFAIFIIVIVASTLALYLFDPSMTDLFDSLWFVIVTLTTVGYGDILPSTAIGKYISILLLIFGVLIFSAVTAAMASYFMKKLITNENYYEENLVDNNDEIIKNKLKSTEKELEEIKSELKENKKINQELKEEIIELKELIKNNK
ncbi:ion channel [uncultured Methanobrevibacter sp.]|uniref:potassium channel family protein n=1 Tax=uncultured Methanobrevibacter sp. TaxID=253161 RepID=UPI0026058034